MSNLASAQKILRLDQIEGADMIEKATVLGWEIVVKKEEFKVGDLCAYIQIDTVVPEKPEFEFLRERAFRVRTIKLRKQISQGLVVPLPAGNWNEGDDLTEVLGVKKFEKGGETPGVMPRSSARHKETDTGSRRTKSGCSISTWTAKGSCRAHLMKHA